jgi:histidine decarboxylase
MSVIKKINKLYDELNKTHNNYIGIQYSQRIKYDNIVNKFSNIHMNNMADPFYPPKITATPNTNEFEREYIQKYGEWIGIDKKDVWGITTSSSSEGLLYGLVFAKNHFKNKRPYVIYSIVHYIIPRYCNLLELKVLTCDANEFDEINTESFHNLIKQNLEYIKKNGLIVVLTMGTTIKCGYDNLPEINKVLSKYNIETYIHLDGALGGLILPFLKDNSINYKKNKFNSISFSAHKMIGTPYSIGVFVTTNKERLKNNSVIISRNDSSLFCSRNGQAVLYMYLYFCDKNSFSNRKKDVEYCLNIKKYFMKKLDKNNIPYYQNPNNGLSIYCKIGTFPDEVIEKYHLLSDTEYTHIFIMVHITKKLVNQFIKDFIKYKNNK